MKNPSKLAKAVLEALARRDLQLSTAESCTGGLLGATLTEIPGSSAHYLGGVISYACSVKHGVLGVSQQDLDTLGPVSEPVARAMAEGAKKITGADVALSTTGLAGPDGDGSDNPVGTVYLACAWGTETRCIRCVFPGNRPEIREAAVCRALELFLEWEEAYEHGGI